jgi:hypothetical protein
MFSISLFVELLRTRPLALFWAMAFLQVALWTAVPLLFYSAPPGELPLVLAVGHEFQFGTEFGPPLAFWLAEIVYRAAGMAGVYLLSQVCVVTTFWAVLRLGRAIVGDSHAVMAVLLMAGIAVFSAPTAEFGPAILAAPLWALLLLHAWLGARHGDWRYWAAAGLEAGLLVLTTYAGLILVGLVVAYLLASRSGRAQLESVGPWLAGLVAVSVLFPYLTWLDLSGGARLIGLSMLVDNVRSWGWLALAVIASHAGMGILMVLGRSPATGSERAPEVLRPPLDPAARTFVYLFALLPVVAMGLFALFSRRPENFIAVPLVVMSGLAVIVAAGDRIRIGYQYAIGYVWLALIVLPPLLIALAIVIQPWIAAADLQVARPAKELGRFFGDSFVRRTARTLEIVAGDRSLASLIALTAPGRPSLVFEAAPGYPERITLQDMFNKGAVIVWPATDTTGRPPPEIAQRFPGLVPEVPQTFERRFQGRTPLLRVGWAMIRPGTMPAPPPAPVEAPAPVLPPQPLPRLPDTPVFVPPEQAPPPPPVQVQPPPAPRAPVPARPTPSSPPRQFDPTYDRHRPQ